MWPQNWIRMRNCRGVSTYKEVTLNQFCKFHNHHENGCETITNQKQCTINLSTEFFPVMTGRHRVVLKLRSKHYICLHKWFKSSKKLRIWKPLTILHSFTPHCFHRKSVINKDTTAMKYLHQLFPGERLLFLLFSLELFGKVHIPQ